MWTIALLTFGMIVVPTAPAAPHVDVVVYGATPSGIAAVLAAARQGKSVRLVEQSNHLGGMVTGGLACSDTGNASAIGGIARELFVRIGSMYGLPPNTAA
jgi:NADPH-dependent 2,4-dienoyl-CoA reductase/sulfur reductase-like enzyme